MIKPAIAIYLQHYLASSMTFIYRQLKGIEDEFNPIVLCSNKLENLERFPFSPIYLKRRNFIRLKEARLVLKIYGHHTLLSIKPKISTSQGKYFEEILVKNNVKLIHCHFGPSALEILPLAKRLNLQLLVTFHGYDASLLLQFENYRNNLMRLFEYANIVTVSDFMKETLVHFGCNQNKINVIRCGIPVEKFQFVKRESLKDKFRKKEIIKFLQVSNFVQKKGHIYTVEAFSRLIKYYPNVKLIFAGSGLLFDKIKKLVLEKGIESYVQFEGNVNDGQVFELMKEADVFIHHSITSDEGDKEGVPTVIMEAMATGLTIVSTYHSGIPELIFNDINGFLVKEKDVDAYYHALINVLNTDSSIGLRAKEKVKTDFSLQNELKKLKNLYKKIISNSHIL